MKKTLFLLIAVLVTALNCPAQSKLQQALPLLQKNNRSAAENQQVLTLFRSAKDPDTVFAAGASLVKIPPSKIQEPVLFNLILKEDDPLKQTFAAIIVTAMGDGTEELLPLVQGALESKDPILQSYAAGAYGLLNPEDKAYTSQVVRLYAFDSAFALRAMNRLADNSKQLLKYLKQASSSADAATRAAAATWLGSLHSEDAAKQLLKMAKTETDSSVQTQIAIGLALNRSYTQEETAKGLRKNYTDPSSATYALALGFMTGNAAETIRQGLQSAHKNERINSARAAAYMAGVLSNPDAFNYTSDRAFDTGLLKSMIPQLKLLAKTGDDSVKIYAENALRQIEKLMN
ncbi:HEAT repeat domain-containing protein [Candidatus Avelusimicrobium gallicola]|uniref:HEAT repeat domain-containing protein n=1 Tax=Candidatus Avelusimicrobium gallicola TaxID=2562704 RepID=A0A1Y4DBC9_9BACT|nr:HEAT repeat domain-containing protein [Elusimicrobium sp. An273]OUO56484.1 hypothetical protein B5F75_04630 [Elusimicrobium sp. An273]